MFSEINTYEKSNRFFILVMGLLLSSVSLASDYPFFDPTEASFKGSFYDEGGHWLISAKKNSDSGFFLRKLIVEFEGTSLVIPKRIMSLEMPKIAEISFRYIQAHNLSNIYTEKPSQVELAWLELKVPYGDTYFCGDTLSIKLTNFIRVEYSISGKLKSVFDFSEASQRCNDIDGFKSEIHH